MGVTRLHHYRMYTVIQTMVLSLVLLISRRAVAIGQCRHASSSMLSYRFFDNIQVVPDRRTADLKDCFNLCRKMSECRSINYKIDAGICELNIKNHITDPQKLEEMSGYVYLAVLDVIKEPAVSSSLNEEQAPTKAPEPKYNTCAKLKQMKPSSPSGVYELQVNGSPKHVYCDMTNFGGGWALVTSISASNNQHTLRTQNNCFNSSLCVPLTTGTLVARKNSDIEIRALASYEGTFRFDVTNTGSTLYTTFYRLTQGAQGFDAGCSGPGCPRMIVSYAYPYNWESNCKGIQTGYQIQVSSSPSNCYKVFDGHDNGECGGTVWFSSGYTTKRVLYSFCTTTGFYSGLQGNMYVR